MTAPDWRDATCETCRYVAPAHGAESRCRRFPPVPSKESGLFPAALYPCVKEDKLRRYLPACAEYAPSEGGTATNAPPD